MADFISRKGHLIGIRFELFMRYNREGEMRRPSYSGVDLHTPLT